MNPTKKQPRAGAPKAIEGARIVGLISDTHGLLRPEALQALRGSDLIIHAGDVGDEEIITALEAIAPVVAVRGNTDTAPWARTLPETAVAETGDVSIYVLHDLQALDLDPVKAGFGIVVTGHTHKPLKLDRGEIYAFNPGSAGPRRFALPVTVARLDLRQAPWILEFINLEQLERAHKTKGPQTL